MTFAHPHILWLLVVLLPAVIGFYWWALRERQRVMTQFIEARLLPGLVSGLSPGRRKFRFACVVLALVLVVFALARPQWGFTWEQSKQKSLDIVVAIDTSKSMLAEDIAPNRLQRAKLAALDLMQIAKSDRLGLVAFAGSAFLQCPMTIDDNAFKQSVDSLDVNAISQGGTALGEAIKTALAAFKEGESHKALVIFTDGEDNDEGAVEEAQAAAKEGLKIFTIGIGTPDGELLRIKDAKGRTDYVRDDQGNVVKSRLNEELLKNIAGAADGVYYRMQGAKTVDALYNDFLVKLPKTENEGKLVRQYNERFHWPLAGAILLLVIEMLVPERRRERKGGNPSNRAAGLEEARPATTTAALGLVTILLAATAAQASPATGALKDYRAGNFEAAQKRYQQALEKQKDDPRLHFNLGTVAYRMTNYTAAAQYFTTALAASDVKLQQAAYYNLGNTQFRTGYASEDLDALLAQWDAAIKSYQSAVTLDKNDKDAEQNLAFVKMAVEQVKAMREAALRARQEADQSLRKRNYHRALEIMESLVQQNIAAKPFEEFTKKLKSIDDIATPPVPAAQP